MPGLYVSRKFGFIGIRIRTTAKQTIVCLDASGLWKPGQSFILAGFTLSLSCSGHSGTGQATIDADCDPSLCGTVLIII